MKHYTVAEIEVTDPSWVGDYVGAVTGMVERRGGRYLARTGHAESLEGSRSAPQTLLLIEWPSKQAAQDFYDSEEYRPFRERRREGSRNEFLLAPAEDAMGIARIDS